MSEAFQGQRMQGGSPRSLLNTSLLQAKIDYQGSNPSSSVFHTVLPSVVATSPQGVSVQVNVKLSCLVTPAAFPRVQRPQVTSS